MNIEYSLFTDCGNREVNEDSIAFAEKNGTYCFVLCDGLGGHGKGDLASKFVTEFVIEYFKFSRNADIFFTDVLDKAQNGLLVEQKRIGARFEMKTTATVLVICGNKYRYAHIGDSRIYCFKKGKVHERTIDHSVPQMLVMAGDIKEKHIRRHPDRNKLLRVMGVEWENNKYEVSDVGELHNGDAFLMCTDGFWEPVTEKEMCKALKKTENSDAWLAHMVETARKNSEGTDMDNFSAIAIVYKD